MADIKFSYKGKEIVIRDEHPAAVISVDGREFNCHHHHPEEGKGLAMWMCDEAYFASPDIKELARHFADYGYMFDDPNRVVVNDEGEVLPSEPGEPPAHPHETPAKSPSSGGDKSAPGRDSGKSPSGRNKRGPHHGGGH